MESAKRIHLTFGRSAGYTLHLGLLKAGDTEDVYTVEDDFSYGILPSSLRDLEERRYPFLKQMFGHESHYYYTIVNFSDQHLLTKVKKILLGTPSLLLTIWVGQHANDHTWLRFLVHEWRDLLHQVEVVLMPMLSIPNRFGEPVSPTTFGSISPEQVHHYSPYRIPLDSQAIQQWQQEYEELVSNSQQLRVYNLLHQTIDKESFHFFDEALLRRVTHELTSAARIIGNTLGDVRFPVSDSFLLYRLITLATNRTLWSTGDPAWMSRYELCKPTPESSSFRDQTKSSPPELTDDEIRQMSILAMKKQQYQRLKEELSSLGMI